jgi:hypothetical protein
VPVGKGMRFGCSVAACWLGAVLAHACGGDTVSGARLGGGQATGGNGSAGASEPGGVILAGGATTTGGAGTTGGAATTGGNAVTGGAGQATVECTTDGDCRLLDGCCFCAAVPQDTPDPSCMRAECKKNECPDPPTKPTPICAFGQCALDVDCDPSQVTCPSAPPWCPAGMLPSVIAHCWGPCIDPTQCRSVPSCSDCGDYVCASLGFMSGTVTRCVRTPAVCEDRADCGCLGAAVCESLPGMLCSDVSPGVLGCACPFC